MGSTIRINDEIANYDDELPCLTDEMKKKKAAKQAKIDKMTARETYVKYLIYPEN